MSNYIPEEHTAGDRENNLELEQALTEALRRVPAPEGFAARVRALAEAEQRTTAVVSTRMESTRWWQFGWKPAWGAAAAILVAGVLSGHAVHEHRIEQQRAEASREFDASIQIQDRAIEHAREQLRKAGVSLDDE